MEVKDFFELVVSVAYWSIALWAAATVAIVVASVRLFTRLKGRGNADRNRKRQ